MLFVVLALLAAPLYAFLSGSVEKDSLASEDLPFRVKSDSDGGRGFGGGFVPGEVLEARASSGFFLFFDFEIFEGF